MEIDTTDTKEGNRNGRKTARELGSPFASCYCRISIGMLASPFLHKWPWAPRSRTKSYIGHVFYTGRWRSSIDRWYLVIRRQELLHEPHRQTRPVRYSGKKLKFYFDGLSLSKVFFLFSFPFFIFKILSRRN